MVVEYPVSVEVERLDLRGVFQFQVWIEDVDNQDRWGSLVGEELRPGLLAERLGAVDVAGAPITYAQSEQRECSACLITEGLRPRCPPVADRPHMDIDQPAGHCVAG